MNDFKNENEIYNNEIDDLNDIKIENEKIKTNKYNEDQIIMDENINFEEQDNIDNENNINENDEEIYDLNDINNDELINNNDNINLEEYNNDYYNNIPENNDQNILYKDENQNQNQSFSQEEELNDNNNYNYNIYLDDMNNINEFNEINMNNNDNIKNFNDKKKLDDIESLKLYIINLEKKCSFLEKENEMIKLNKESDPNYSIVENSLKQGTILLEDVKRKNFNLNKKIKILEKKNQELNYKLIEANQKIKRFQSNNKNNNINTNKNINSILMKLNKKVDESEILISKLKFDKKLLETKLSEDKKYHENELNLMLNYKNSELSIYQKAIDDFKSQNNNTIHLNKNGNTNNKINTLQNKLKKISDKNKNLEEKIKTQKKNITEKDNLINSLNKKIIELEGNFNLELIEMQQISAENEAQISKLINEKNELIKNNEKLSNGLMQFDNKVKEANLIFMNKTDFYDKSISLFKNKINEYKNKVVLLKKKIKELNLIIEKNNINNNTKPKLNNNDIYKRNLSSTPGSFMIPRRRMTPFTTKIFEDKSDFIQNNSINMNLNKTNVDIIQDKNKTNFDYLNKSQISQINDNNNLDNNLGYEEDNNQKIFLEKYKSFLTKLKV